MSEKFFGLWFAFCAILGVAWLAFCAWAIVQIVEWVTTK